MPSESSGRHQRGRAAVFEQEREALFGVAGVQGHIGAARLEDPEQPDDELQGALDADRDEHVGADASRGQLARESVGALIELPIGQRIALEGHGHGVRRSPRLLFEQLVDAQGRVRDVGVVPRDQQPVSVRVRQIGRSQVGHGLRPRVGQRLAIGLAGGRPREVRQHDVGRRPHELGQGEPHLLAPRAGVDRRVGVERDVAHQLPFPMLDDGFPDAG